MNDLFKAIAALSEAFKEVYLTPEEKNFKNIVTAKKRFSEFEKRARKKIQEIRKKKK